MPFIPNTPESYLSRADSLDADTTCHGITSNGNPCRRSLAATPSGTPSGSPASKRSRQQKQQQQQGRLDRQELYCWQHKDQAAHHSPSPSPMSKKSGRSGAGSELVYRSSIDTLVERLGILKVDSELGEKGKVVQGRSGGGPRRCGKKTGGGRSISSSGALRKLLLCCFCFNGPTGEKGETQARPVRPQPRPVQRPNPKAGAVPSTPTKVRPADPAAGRATSAPPRLFGPEAGRPRPSSGANRRQKPGGPNSLSLIPASLAPEAATSLKTELERPFVESEEPGYIYMFWMTPTNTKTPPVEAAREFLSPNTAATRTTQARRPAADVIDSYYDAQEGEGSEKKKSKKKNKNKNKNKKKKTMLLKIGRTSNVQRRMNEWSRQCGYDVEVLRFYPYVSGAERGMAGTIGTSMMTPHVKKVERLIHLELLGMGLRAELGTCDACGREHREWFEVEVSRENVRAVDDVIRRWVEWDEGNI